MKSLIILVLSTITLTAQPRVELYKLGTNNFTLATVQQPNNKCYFESSPTPYGPWTTFSSWTVCDGSGGWLITQIPNNHSNKFFRARQTLCK